MRILPFVYWRLVILAALSCGQVNRSANAQSSGPTILQVIPAPGFVEELSSITVFFSQSVTGVLPVDFLVNGVPATSVTGAGARYTFQFAQPPYGPVEISWGTLHTIFNLNNPPQRFDGGLAGATWAYQLSNPAGPTLLSEIPVPGTVLNRLSEVEVRFDQPVTGVDASDLKLNGIAATSLSGTGAGPYRFIFAQVPAGQALLEWIPAHGIATDEPIPHAFKGATWRYTVDPLKPIPAVIINEILAENQTGLLDEDKDPEDWIELYNGGEQPVNLEGWSLSVDREDEGQWVFPSVNLPARGYLLVWASGKDRSGPPLYRSLHTNFKLNPNGDTLRLFGPELPRVSVSELEYPAQSPNYSYGRQIDAAGVAWRYFAPPTPTQANSLSTITGRVEAVHFSVERGFFNAPFTLSLASKTPDAEIRYTLDGSPPTTTNGTVYLSPISIANTRVVRASAFAPNRLPAGIATHTYLLNLANNRRLLPVLSLVTATNNLYGRSGIMEYSPRNTTKHGAAWERPTSVEWIRPEDNDGFQMDAGLRVAGGDYIRQRYNYRVQSPPEGKYSFRLYFRGDYGAGQLKYPVFPASTLDSYNTLHLRAGMNDPSNPFLKDEFIRALSLDVGIPACHGTFVYLFLNGVYKGLYNPCERVDDDFLQAYRGGAELWDVMGPNSAAIRGDTTAWTQLRAAARKDLTVLTNYLDVAARMDLPNFIDYLLPLLWADNDDWPHNNTRAAREKKAGAPFRFYPWDAEFAFTGHPVSYDTLANTLSSVNPPWGTTDYQAIFNSLKKAPEFKLLFADRVHRAFFNDGPLTDPRIRTRYSALKGQVAPAIANFNDVIGPWITARRRYVTNSFQRAGLLASSNAPTLSQFGGPVRPGFSLTLQNLSGAIWFTTNGTDPRVAFSGSVAPASREYRSPLTVAQPMHILARSLDGTNWSALVDATFRTTTEANPLRISEIMYHPLGGDAFEYIELRNTGALPVDLSGYIFEGVQFRFPIPFPILEPGESLILASDARPADFQRQYPQARVAGWFGGSLSNGGERIRLLDSEGRLVTSVEYKDQAPWPAAADGAGSALELTNLAGDPNDPANWHASILGGTPGSPNSVPLRSVLEICELSAGSNDDWIELHNRSAAPVRIEGWSLSDDPSPRQFVFPPGTPALPADGYLQVKCRRDAVADLSVAPFQLDRDGETIALYSPDGERQDIVSFGPALDGFTLGQVDGRWTLCSPTPAGVNRPADLGDLSQLTINEFMASPESGGDWIEFYNGSSAPVSLFGCTLVTSNAIAQVLTPVFVGPTNFVVLWADDSPIPGHLNLKFPAAGGSITFIAPSGQELDRVVYTTQLPGTSMGRLPDGTGTMQPLPYTPTRGGSNDRVNLGTDVRISEILALASSGADSLELENISPAVMALDAWTLELQTATGPNFRWPLPQNTSLAPRARLALSFGAGTFPGLALPNALSVPQELPNEGATLVLRDTFGRMHDRVAYGPQLPDRSIGRVGSDWVLLDAPSLGSANGQPAALDAGSELRINEWLAGGGTNDFVELYNPAALPVSLGGWVLTDDPSIFGSTNRRIAALTFIAPRAFVSFHTDDADVNAGNHLAFKLDRLGETLRLLNPSGQIVDSVDYVAQRDSISEGRFPDGAGQIKRFPDGATPGTSNSRLIVDRDQDGMSDSWEITHKLNPSSPADALLDADGDGASNLDEFHMGTDPHDALSHFALTVAIDATTRLNLRFRAEPDVSYLVQYADNIANAQWIDLAQITPSLSGRDVEVADNSAARSGPATRFYRVIIAP